LPYYEDIFLKRLQVPKEFLTEHASVIQDKLRCAVADFGREHSQMWAINQCLHLATSIILSYPARLNETLAALRENAELRKQNQDPSGVLTIIALYYVLEAELKRVAAEKKTAKGNGKKKPDEYEIQLKLLQDRFYKVNWLIGKEAMEALGFATQP
jgi:hypothetical protein